MENIPNNIQNIQKTKTNMKIKTQFWETIDNKKVSKLIWILTIIHTINTIATNKIIYLLIMNILVLTLLTLILISYQKYEGTTKWKQNQQKVKQKKEEA